MSDFDETGGPPRTGDPEVDEALGRLDQLADLPLEQHGEVFRDVQDRLSRVLERGPDSGDEATFVSTER
jgi:hypothetical protein